MTLGQGVTYADLLGTRAHIGARTYSEPSDVDIFAFLAARPEWMADAACKGMDTNQWYPSRGDSRLESTVEAKAICGGCQVREECLEYALSSHPMEFGIWAGLSEKQRKTLRLRDPRYRLDRRQHGTISRYNDGCRCDLCRRANADYRRSSKERSRRNRLAKGAA